MARRTKIAKRKTARPKTAARTSSRRRRQVAAIPVRRGRGGQTEVLLLTSRESGRWVIPKGWPKRKLTPAETAALEAYEEGGLKGVIGDGPIGSYRYRKQVPGKKAAEITVLVFVLVVRRQAKSWPEQDERESRWFKSKRAATLVAEPGLAKLLNRVDRLIGKSRA